MTDIPVYISCQNS